MSGPVEERRHPSTIGGALYIAVVVIVVAGLALTLSDWRVGIKVVAGALSGAALARLVLPRRDAGMLAVRHRAVDVTLLTGVAAALWLLAETIPNQPGD